jgi:superfamily II DNA or RNA helicase
VLWKIEIKSPKLLYTSGFNNSMKKNSGYEKESRINPVILTTIERENVRLNSYIGKKGYTIPKAELPKGEEEFLKKDLFLKPFVPGAQFGNPNDPSAAFPVYRENNNKMYLPRFYGIQRYGVPDRCDIEPGDDIDVPFELSLRDYQQNIVDIYCNHVSKPLSKDNAQHGGGGILEVYCGAGKCNGLNTPIMMYDGTIKMVQDIKVGDVIMGDDSTPRNILTLARGREQMYKVIPKKGDSYTVNESHILSLKYSSNRNKNTPKGSIRDISVLDYLNLPKSYHGLGGPLLGYRVPVVFPTVSVKIDPYLLGYWLGDGATRTTLISTQEAYVLKYLTADCFQNKHPSLYLQYTGSQYDYRINSINTGVNKTNELMNYLREYNLIQNKHIPHDYKCNDRTTQLELLAGIIDSDGSASNNTYDIIQKNERLLDDIIFIARSLGFAAYKKECKKHCMYKGEKKEGTYYRTCIHGKGLDEIPVKCPRKKVTPRKQIKDALSTRIKLEKLEVDDYYGFEIDGNRRFVLGDCTVTHNTVMALNIISNIKKKTLILVHKEFLMNQWIERMNEFLPTARIGKIQGPTFDIEDKDVVIGMIQSLYDKEYAPNAFSSFGLTIIDEVHRIGSEQFSRTLFKTITPYMLGISATVERKDKLSKLLYMFIGGKIYESKRKEEDPVCVRAIEYISADTDFNNVEIDYRGNTKFSSMIVKLCAFGPRSDFIVKVLGDLLEEHPDNQIMILCQNKSLLNYLYEAINYRELASVGYYIGGMKQVKLQETETKKIVLATYAMAAEALDIKTLSTLVMVSPKTDIVQSVGRILRVKHKHPIIVDIVDMHENFQKQWLQRRRFYKKCNYRIRMTDSKKYTNMLIDWEIDTTWKRVYEPKETVDGGEDDEEEIPVVRKCLINIADY